MASIDATDIMMGVLVMLLGGMVAFVGHQLYRAVLISIGFCSGALLGAMLLYTYDEDAANWWYVTIILMSGVGMVAVVCSALLKGPYATMLCTFLTCFLMVGFAYSLFIGQWVSSDTIDSSVAFGLEITLALLLSYVVYKQCQNEMTAAEIAITATVGGYCIALGVDLLIPGGHFLQITQAAVTFVGSDRWDFETYAIMGVWVCVSVAAFLVQKRSVSDSGAAAETLPLLGPNSLHGAPITVPAAAQPQPEKTQEELDKLEEDGKLCKICFDNEINTVLLDCGHQCCCTTCATQLSDCPICRQPIARIVTTYTA